MILPVLLAARTTGRTIHPTLAMSSDGADAAVPEIELSARRLILVLPDRDPDDEAGLSSSTAAHVAELYGSDIRYLMASPTDAALRQAESISAAMRTLIIGGLAVETSRLLAVDADEPTAMEDALTARDQVLRGTRPGSASVIVGDEGALGQILSAALGSSEAVQVPPASVTVLDFDEGSWPAIVADELPSAQLVGFEPRSEPS